MKIGEYKEGSPTIKRFKNLKHAKFSIKQITTILIFFVILGFLLGIVAFKLVRYKFNKIEQEQHTVELTSDSSEDTTQSIHKTGNGDEKRNSDVDDVYALYNFYHTNVNNHELIYVDDKCGLSFSFPQISFQNNEVFLWIVEAGNDRSFVSYLGREQPSDELDNHVILYTKAPDDSSIHWFTRLFVLCVENSEQLTLNEYVENYLGLLQKKVDEKNLHYDPKGYKYLGEKEIGGYKFIEVGGNSDNRIVNSYLGIVSNKLYLIEYVEEAQDSIGQELLSVISGIQFTPD